MFAGQLSYALEKMAQLEKTLTNQCLECDTVSQVLIFLRCALCRPLRQWAGNWNHLKK